MAYKYHYSDGGRSESRRPKQRGDCTVRALALACDLPYDVAYDILTAAGRTRNRGFRFTGFVDEQLLPGYEFEWIPFPAAKGKQRMRHATFGRLYPKGTFILKTAHHVATFKDGTLYDTSQPHATRCIYGAWRVKRTQEPLNVEYALKQIAEIKERMKEKRKEEIQQILNSYYEAKAGPREFGAIDLMMHIDDD